MVNLKILEQEICSGLNISKSHQYKSNLSSSETGILIFAKESSHCSGTKLESIADKIEDFYKKGCFKLTKSKIKTHGGIKGLAIPPDYFRSIFMIADNNDKKYTINISQGDVYTVSIMESNLIF